MNDAKWENKLVQMRKNSERRKQIQLEALNRTYNIKLKDYVNVINIFYKHIKGNERNRDYAINRLRPSIILKNGQLNNILKKIRRLVNQSNLKIKRNGKEIIKNRQSLHSQNKLIKDKGKYIADLQVKITSGHQRVLISNEKTLFKKNFIVFFILLSMIFIYLILKFKR